MLENQKRFIEYTEKVENIISPISVIQEKEKGQKFSQIEKLKDLQQKIKTHELIVPVIGGFSAGKSTLINSFLGGDFLPIGIQPETALPAELKYHSTDYIEAVTEKGKIDQYSLADFEIIKQKVKSEEYRYLKVYLNNQNLKAIQPLVLVDMPGFSSPVLGHNEVIINYTAKGIFFIFLNSVETQGTLQGNILEELKRINEIKKGFSFCLSKTNLKPASQVDEIKEEVIEKLEDEIDDFDGKVVLLDENGGENLKKIVQSIDPNDLVKKVFLEQLEDNYTETDDLIKNYIRNLQQDSENLELTIKEIEDSFNKIVRQKNKAIKEIKSQDTEETKNVIINRVTTAIIDRRQNLAELALQNKNLFTEELHGTVKNCLSIELKKHLEKMSDKVILDFESEIDSLSCLQAFDPHFVDAIVEKIRKDIEKSDTSIDLSIVMTFISTLAGLFSGTIGVILKEVVRILDSIPIISSITRAFSSSNNDKFKEEANKQEALYKIQEHICNEIVKEIKSKLESKIPGILGNALENVVNAIANEFEQKLKVAQMANKVALNEQKNNFQDVKQKIQQLENTLSQLESLKQQYLK
ncbi:dynamin family protein [Histophilus somni]|nr:dynamin family protein [Histophilus somni]